jgi:opacity protein-like surface antigen
LYAAICVGLCIASSAACAGGYVGAGAGIATSNATTENKDTLGYGNTSKKETGSGGFKIYGGYTVANWGAELGYYDLGNYRIAGSIGNLYAEDKFEGSAAALSLVRNFPIGETLMIHGKLGAASVETKYHCVQLCNGGLPDTSKTVVSPLFGVGFSWAFMKNLAVRGDWDFITNGKSRIGTSGSNTQKTVSYSLLSANIEYRF